VVAVEEVDHERQVRLDLFAGLPELFGVGVAEKGRGVPPPSCESGPLWPGLVLSYNTCAGGLSRVGWAGHASCLLTLVNGGTVTCPAGANFRVFIVVNQGGAAILSEGTAHGRCTGEPARFTGTARKLEPPHISPGPAQVCLTAYDNPLHGFANCFNVSL
jgi:hypothetical protein